MLDTYSYSAGPPLFAGHPSAPPLPFPPLPRPHPSGVLLPWSWFFYSP